LQLALAAGLGLGQGGVPRTQTQGTQGLQGQGLQGQGGQGTQGLQGQGLQGQGQGGQPRRIEVHLTPEENEAVNNLTNMGFDRNKVLHYYILFEKDQEMTANYLLNHGREEEFNDDQGQGNQ